MSSRDDKIEYLDSERKKLWEKVTLLEGEIDALQEDVSKKTSDYEESAKESSEKAQQYKVLSEEAKNSIIEGFDEVNTKLSDLRTNFASFEQLSADLKSYAADSQSNSNLVKTLYDAVQAKSNSLQSQIADIEKILEGKPALDEKLAKLQAVFVQGDDYDTKLRVLFTSLTDRKKEIDELYYSIIGYSQKNETGVETKIAGIKDQLQASYDEVKKQFDELEKSLVALDKNTAKNFDEFIDTRQATFNEAFKKWEENYSTINQKMEDLLPKALTTGLSYAYSEKKTAEEKERKGFSTTFLVGIGGLIFVSLIPFGISITSLFNKVPLEDVIKRSPQLVLAILPLYIPVLWLAYSSNRKMNLSKRLIEEYSHKEVLSKTFEGLSKQISNIEDTDISSDLRVRLLYNILEVNSENPGKLISDYNKSDHPVMDALEKSIKLTNAVTKLSKIPGMNKLLSSLEKKSEAVLNEQSKKAEAGLEAVTPTAK